MESKLIKQWMEKGLKPSTDFEFFTKRDNVVVGKIKGQEAIVEYECPDCKNYEITNKVELEKSKNGKKFLRPKFKCSKCGKKIVVKSLRK